MTTYSTADNNCPDCQAAAVRPHHLYRAHCFGCTARAIGRVPDFAESGRQGWLTPRYQNQLRALGLSHAEVKAARAVDFEATGHVSTPYQR